MVRWITALLLLSMAVAQTPAPRSGDPQEPTRDVPACRENVIKGKRFAAGHVLVFRIPKGTRQQRFAGTDSFDMKVFFPEDPSEIALFNRDVHVTRPIPEEFLRDSETHVHTTLSHNDHELGYDDRGTLKNGKRWRFVADYAGASFQYRATPQAAAYFDRILDDVCQVMF